MIPDGLKSTDLNLERHLELHLETLQQLHTDLQRSMDTWQRNGEQFDKLGRDILQDQDTLRRTLDDLFEEHKDLRRSIGDVLQDQDDLRRSLEDLFQSQKGLRRFLEDLWQGQEELNKTWKESLHGQTHIHQQLTTLVQHQDALQVGQKDLKQDLSVLESKVEERLFALSLATTTHSTSFPMTFFGLGVILFSGVVAYLVTVLTHHTF